MPQQVIWCTEAVPTAHWEQRAHAFLGLTILGNPVDLQLAEPERVSSTAVQHAKRHWSLTATASCCTAAPGELILVLPLRPLRQGTSACSSCMNLRLSSAHRTCASSGVGACSWGAALAAWQCMALAIATNLTMQQTSHVSLWPPCQRCMLMCTAPTGCLSAGATSPKALWHVPAAESAETRTGHLLGAAERGVGVSKG